MSEMEFKCQTIDFDALKTSTKADIEFFRILDFLIQFEASADIQIYQGTPKALKNFLHQHSDKVHGIALYTGETIAVGYCTYEYEPTESGNKIAISNNAFITESFRPFSAAQLLLQNLACKLLSEGAEGLTLRTDFSNPSFHILSDKKVKDSAPKQVSLLRSHFFEKTRDHEKYLELYFSKQDLEELQALHLNSNNTIFIERSAPIGPAIRPPSV